MINKNKKTAFKPIKIFISLLLLLNICFFSGCSFFDEIFDYFGDDIDVSGKFAVHFIDVGQGDSILIQSPDNEFMLIDTGERDQYDKLTAYLDHFGAKRFKYVIFTHPHSDHIGSANNIVKNYDIETLIMSSVTHTSKTFGRLVKEIEKKKIEITEAVCGDIYDFGEAQFTVLAPISDNYRNLNNYSVAILMDYGNTSFLFTGDMEKESEYEVIRYCKENNFDISVDVLKVSHHGSSTSSQTAFLKLVNPSFAVIMCGNSNSYNHPNIKTVGRVESAGAEVYRTDLDGDIVIISDGKDLTVKKGREAAVEYKTGNYEGEEFEKEVNEDFVEEE